MVYVKMVNKRSEKTKNIPIVQFDPTLTESHAPPEIGQKGPVSREFLCCLPERRLLTFNEKQLHLQYQFQRKCVIKTTTALRG